MAEWNFAEKIRLPYLLLLLCVFWIFAGLGQLKYESLFNARGFAEIPVLHGGRIKPLDSVARSSLLLLSGKQTLRDAKERKPAVLWLMDMLFAPDRANSYKVFEIDDPDVLGILNIHKDGERLFSFSMLEAFLPQIEEQAEKALKHEPSSRSRFQVAILNLYKRIMLYYRLQSTIQRAGDEKVLEKARAFESELFSLREKYADETAINIRDPNFSMLMKQVKVYRMLSVLAEFRPVPPDAEIENADEWMDLGSAITLQLKTGKIPEIAFAYLEIADAYRAGNVDHFNEVLRDIRAQLESKSTELFRSVRLEYVFNSLEPFYRTIGLYLLVFLLAFLSWLVWPRILGRSAYWLLILAFIVHSLGLAARMFLQGRPPVTNLYSSAVFVGWGAVLLSIILERFSRRGIGSAAAGLIGFSTLIIAHHLASQGDTMEMMRAVLDSNFWLTTHVITITLGYSATFLSGFVAIVYILRRWLDKRWTEDEGSLYLRMLYGIVCFSLFFSFLGTILGGIWADQSWGRFWGWDPKENGALLVVLWNAFILHVRRGNFASTRALMQMAVFGSVLTVLSWFGVNMLGVGLHSYGFMDQGFCWLLIFSLSQLIIICVAWMPTAAARRMLAKLSNPNPHVCPK